MCHAPHIPKTVFGQQKTWLYIARVLKNATRRQSESSDNRLPRSYFYSAQSRSPRCRAGLLTRGSSLFRRLPIPCRTVAWHAGQLPVHSGATVADFHRLPY